MLPNMEDVEDEPQQPPEEAAVAIGGVPLLGVTRGTSSGSGGGGGGSGRYSREALDATPAADWAQRPDYLKSLVRHRRASVRYIDRQLGNQDSAVGSNDDATSTTTTDVASSLGDFLTEEREEKLMEQTAVLKKALAYRKELNQFVPVSARRVEVRLDDVSYHVPLPPDTIGGEIKTVANQSPCWQMYEFYLAEKQKREDERVRSRHVSEGREHEGKVTHRPILSNVNLVIKPGRTYLVLGPPGCGKTTLLKAIASLLPGQKFHRKAAKKGEYQTGTVEYNGLGIDNKMGHIFSNAVAYVDQIDRHAPRLTVQETFDFAFQCKSGGTHVDPAMFKDDCGDPDGIVCRLDKENARVKLVLEALGMSHVADTFVGDSDVRGVSGGQRRRVTVGEMLQFPNQVFCGDEISTGLDAKSTYDIVNILCQLARIQKNARVISLLQPSPETFSLFDDIILLMEGHVIYAGPVEGVVDYFEALGYPLPRHMDVADFLNMIPTQDGKDLFRPNSTSSTPYNAETFAETFRNSETGLLIQQELASAWPFDWSKTGTDNSPAHQSAGRDEETGTDDIVDYSGDYLKTRYRNNFARSTWLNIRRHFTIWKRDRRFIIANAIKNVVMGISVGAVFFQTDSVASIFGVLFQGVLFIMLGAMTSAPAQLPDRSIFYRHYDANFYPTFSYVIGRVVSLIPQSMTDVIIFGSILYWMVGLVPQIECFLIFLAMLISFSLVMAQELGVFAAISPTAALLQGFSAFFLLLHMLFCGFIVNPDVIPKYYMWLYWWNPLAWVYRGLILNEFTSGKWLETVKFGGKDEIKGELVLKAYGFTWRGEIFPSSYVGFTFAYVLPYFVMCAFFVGVCLFLVRCESSSGADKDGKDTAAAVAGEEAANGDENGNGDDADDAADVEFPFTQIDLSFEDICYDVKASTSGETLRLLNNVNGVFKAGRMCALMGSSGAGKTTLMDVIALRKASGTITGEVRLNGHLQQTNTFRRCSGYVEQFDVQSPQLTVRETIMFSAWLRLDNTIGEDETQKDLDNKKMQFVDQIISMLELTPIKDSIVGTDAEGGLSFEEKKRLSIAVELAASPSIIFLDEPTSGLDARAALIVMRSMKKIAETGRSVCATIHQPSSAVFEMFDDLLLLKKGGHVVYFGDLGHRSINLVNYFESNGADQISHGENPSTWMLSVIGGGSSTAKGEPIDFAEVYRGSDEFKKLGAALLQIKEEPGEEVAFDDIYARSFWTRNNLMNKRLVLIYWRSPSYNLGRLVLSMVIAFILGSVFLTQRNPPDGYTETQISSVLSTIFISFIITGVMAQTSVLPVMLAIRDVFYRQRAAGMMNHASLAWALGTAEKRFICLSTILFCLIFYFSIGLNLGFFRFAAFWGFFTFNLAIYSYFGQAFMCVVRGMGTASILCSVFIGINNLFSGLIVRPQYLTGFWSITYWICPGHYVFEGLVTTQFYDDMTPVTAFTGSNFYEYLVLLGECDEASTNRCVGTVSQYVFNFFGGRFSRDHVPQNAFILGLFLVAARAMTFWGLYKFNYVNT